MQERKPGRELTLAIIKPDAVAAGHAGRIVSELVREGFEIRAVAEARLSEDGWARFYAEHEGSLFFGELIEFMASGHVIAMALERDRAVRRLRLLAGDTDPARALAGTIRSEFGTRMPANAIHRSAGRRVAVDELLYFFSPDQLPGVNLW